MEEPKALSDPRRRRKGRDTTLHAAALALVLWTVAIVGFGRLALSGRAFDADFVQFYTMAAMAADGQYAGLISDGALHAEQVRRLPASRSAHYPPVYGPQVALALSPLARLSFFEAQGVLALFTLCSVILVVLGLRAWMPTVAAWPAPLAAALAAFPPLTYTVLVGQISVLALFAATLVVVALGRGSRVCAGIGIGILAYKFSLFVPALAVCILSGEWMIAAVAVGAGGLQVAGVAPIVGTQVVWGYLENALSFLRHADDLAAKPQFMASLRTFWAALVTGRIWSGQPTLLQPSQPSAWPRGRGVGHPIRFSESASSVLLSY